MCNAMEAFNVLLFFYKMRENNCDDFLIVKYLSYNILLRSYGFKSLCFFSTLCYVFT